MELLMGILVGVSVVGLVAVVVLVVDHRDAKRHQTLEQTINHNHRILLTAVQQYQRLDAAVEDLKLVATDHADLIDARAEPGARPARRPKT